MAFGFGKEKKNNLNRGGADTGNGGKKGAGAAIIAVVAALVVFELGKSLGMLLVQFSLPMYFPVLFSGTEEAAEEFLNQPMMGATIQEILGSILSLVMQLAGGMLCLALWRKELSWRMKPQKNVQENRVNRPYWQKVVLFFAVAVFGCLGLNLIMNGLQLTLFSETFMEVAAEQASVPLIFGILMYGLVSPLAEEIVFRGVIYGKMRAAIGVSMALPLAALFFAIYHGNIVQGIYAAMIGAVLCYVYEKSGSLWVPVIFHGIGNLAVYLLIGVGGAMDILGNVAAGVLGIILTGLAVGAFYLCFGKPKLD